MAILLTVTVKETEEELTALLRKSTAATKPRIKMLLAANCLKCILELHISRLITDSDIFQIYGLWAYARFFDCRLVTAGQSGGGLPDRGLFKAICPRRGGLFDCLRHLSLVNIKTDRLFLFLLPDMCDKKIFIVL